MTNEQAVLNLLREKESYKEEAKYLREALESIHQSFYCIGGPLNDNKLKFDKMQMKYFSDLAKIIDHVI